MSISVDVELEVMSESQEFVATVRADMYSDHCSLLVVLSFVKVESRKLEMAMPKWTSKAVVHLLL